MIMARSTEKRTKEDGMSLLLLLSLLVSGGECGVIGAASGGAAGAAASAGALLSLLISLQFLPDRNVRPDGDQPHPRPERHHGLHRPADRSRVRDGSGDGGGSPLGPQVVQEIRPQDHRSSRELRHGEES